MLEMHELEVKGTKAGLCDDSLPIVPVHMAFLLTRREAAGLGLVQASLC